MTWHAGSRVWALCSRTPTGSSTPMTRCAARSAFMKRSSRHRTRLSRICNLWRPAATSWALSSPAAVPAVPRRPHTRQPSPFNKTSFGNMAIAPSTARAWHGTAIIWRCFRTPPGVLRKPSKRFAPRSALLLPSIEGPQALPGAQWQFARASNNLGVLFLSQRRDDAGQPLKRAQDILLKLTAEFPTIAQYSQELAAIDYNLGLMTASAGHQTEALASFRESARLLESLLQRFPEAPVYRLKLAMTNIAMSDALAKTAPAEAETALRKAVQVASAVLAEYPDVPEYQSVLGRGHYLLARLLQEKGLATYKPAEAIQHAEQAQSLHEKVVRAASRLRFRHAQHLRMIREYWPAP